MRFFLLGLVIVAALACESGAPATPTIPGMGGSGASGGGAGHGGASGAAGIGGVGASGGAAGVGGAGGQGGMIVLPGEECSALPPDPDVSAATIDSIYSESPYEFVHRLTEGMFMASGGTEYYLDDGTSWPSGAGTTDLGYMRLDHITQDGSTIRYHMTPDTLFQRRTDYSFGDHHANYEFHTIGEFVLVAELDSTSARLEGEVIVVKDAPVTTPYPTFNHLSAPLCAVVPFVGTYTLLDGKAFDVTLFDGEFRFESQVTIYLTSCVDECTPLSDPPNTCAC